MCVCSTIPGALQTSPGDPPLQDINMKPMKTQGASDAMQMTHYKLTIITIIIIIIIMILSPMSSNVFVEYQTPLAITAVDIVNLVALTARLYYSVISAVHLSSFIDTTFSISSSTKIITAMVTVVM